MQRNKPLTRSQVEELPKGYTPAKFINRKTYKGLILGKLAFDTIKGLYTKPVINSRSLTRGRVAHRSFIFGRPLATLTPKLKKDATESDIKGAE